MLRRPPIASRSHHAPAAVIVLAVASCATGTGLSGTGGGATSSSSSASSTTSSSASSTSSSGVGGSGGATSSSSGSGGATSSSSGAGGSGGATSSSSSASSASSSTTSSSSSSSGNPPTGVLIMLAGGGTKVLGGEYHPGNGWSTNLFMDATNDGPAVALASPTAGIGVIRSTANAGEVRFSTWSPGAWSGFGAIGAGVTTRATPAIAASGAVANLVFHGDDFKFYFGAHSGAWSPTAEPITFNGDQSFGPNPPSITTLGTDAIVAFAGSNHDLYDQARSGGVWQAAHAHGLGDAVLLTPAIVSLTAGPDLMIAFVRSTDARIVYTTRTSGAWSAPAPIDTNALSNDPVSLAALPGGEAVLAYRGQNGKTYWSRYTPSASPAWTLPTGITATNYDTPSPPAVAPGISGADAEMVFVDMATGAANHTRLTGTTWSTPTPIGGSGLTRVAIATNPN